MVAMKFTFEVLLLTGTLFPSPSVARWLGIPTVPFVETNSTSGFSLSKLSSIVVDSAFQNSVDTNGETLIPPNLLAFATTFGADLLSSVGMDVPVMAGDAAIPNSIFFTLGKTSDYLDVAGRETSEGYSIDVTSEGIVITGASPLGAWWGTRSILQQAILGETEFAAGSAVDSPGWGVRGFMLDAGRKYYPAEFLIELCSYMSFFKQNVLHLHLNDAQNLNPDISMERKLEFYSAFRLLSDNPELDGLNKRANESYTEAVFENVQQSCAARGVTILPEFDTPGHSLVITQWKPELALSTDFSMLNISHPDTIPTMQTIWKTFLPWFHSKTVHLGADEYSSAEIPEYNRYVNTLQQFISAEANKKVRIWGTFTPDESEAGTGINTNVSIQHWEFFEGNPYYDFISNNYSVLNSDDGFYAVAKYSGSYPQKLNLTRVFHGAPGGGPYAPNIFDTSNATNNPARDNALVLGQMPVLWNDFGPNSTSVIEVYYSVREGLPALGDKQWGGDLLMEEFTSIFEFLHPGIPGQNLDRRIASKTDTILSYDFRNSSSAAVLDTSGNGYHGSVSGNCTFTNSTVKLTSGCAITTPLTSKGRNYTLSFSVNPTSSTPGALFSGPDSILKAGNGSISNVMLITGGVPYILNYTIPLNTWTDVSLVGINNATYLSVTDSASATQTFEFTTTLGIYDNSFVWGNPMIIEAPLNVIGGDGFEGQLKKVKLVDGADPTYAALAAPLVIGVAPYL
ncbi:glycosyl hydrolase family 20 [Phlyctema vagabunda]|uniref:beta-N-acetylhexosaminidase n=1 Tax=Phlyctema vagabunda TaxID=108571 RepID=A0ABR4PL75_9HELO